MPTPALSGCRESAFSRPGPAWNDELAATAAAARWWPETARTAQPLPAAARAMSAIWVESARGIPTCSRTASAVIPIVRRGDDDHRQRDACRARTGAGRPAPSWPSWPMAVDGASVPVASAIATGNDSSTAITADAFRAGHRRAGRGRRRGCGEPVHQHRDRAATNSSVITANTSRPPWPNQVSPATASSRPRPSTIRDRSESPARRRSGR